MITIELTPDIKQKAEVFAAKVHTIRSSRDSFNNDTGDRRIIHEKIGKFGECGVAQHLKLTNLIDFKIHVKPQYGPDLGSHIYVKTCNIEFKDKLIHGVDYDSWIAHVNDYIFMRPDPNNKIILAYAGEAGRVEIYGYVMANQIVNKWRSCVNIEHKIAIYKRDIDALITKF